MKNKLYASMAIIILIFTTFNLYARNGDREKERRGRMQNNKNFRMGPNCLLFGNLTHLKGSLNLSDTQLNKIGTINKKYQIEFLKLKEKIAPKSPRLKRLLLEKNININNVRILLKEIAEVKIEIRILRIKQRLEIEQLLSEEQKNKLRNEKRHKRRRMRHE
jgi:Spy/CpxP family protein refolding chaperone